MQPIDATAARTAATPPALELWGGMECSLVRVGDDYNDQFLTGGHADPRRADADLRRVASLGIRTLRYPISWERVCPNGEDPAEGDWTWTDARLATIRELGIRPIVTLVHHGSGPRDTSLVDPAFPIRLAQFARAAAERYPWVMDWTPINEPLTTARFSGLYGHWYPHGRDEETFLRCLLTELRATVLAMRAVRKVNADARLIQTEDLGKTYSTPRMAYQARFENERRWVSFDLLCGRLIPEMRMWGHLRWAGIEEAELLWFRENPCPPDVLGINHYLTSERFLDERRGRYPAATHGSNGRDRYADVEAVRVLGDGCAGAGTLLLEAWERFGLPVAITEAHLGCTREEQMRWLADVWREAKWAREARSADVRAVTVWSLFGAWDWDSLLTEKRNNYESGVFDVRGKPEPRETGLAELCRVLARGEDPAHPVLDTPGWWRRPARLLYASEPTLAEQGDACPMPLPDRGENARPLLIAGGSGSLGDALRRECEIRGLACVAPGSSEMDIADAGSVDRALERYHPWAVINAAGYANVDLAEVEPFECLRANVKGPAVLAALCLQNRLPLALFSSAMVFDGAKAPEPYVESDPVRPRSVYGRSKARMEEVILKEMPGALVVRSSALFGPWDGRNFLTRSLQALARGNTVYASSDDFLTPAYLPDFANRVLDLLIDGAGGIWHLAHPEPVSRYDMIRWAADAAGLDAGRLLHPVPKATLAPGGAPHTPTWAVLSSERTAPLLPALGGTLRHFVDHAAGQWTRNPASEAHHFEPGSVLREAERLLRHREALRW